LDNEPCDGILFHILVVLMRILEIDVYKDSQFTCC
jgi:hypothetical protein